MSLLKSVVAVFGVLLVGFSILGMLGAFVGAHGALATPPAWWLLLTVVGAMAILDGTR